MDLDDAPQRTVLAEPLDRLAQAEIERRWYQLRDEIGVALADREHRFGLCRVGRHPRLAEHVLARFERGSCVFEVHVGPRADADRVDRRIGEQFLDRLGDPGNVPFRRDALARCARAIDHIDDFHVVDLAEAGDVTQLLIAARADQSNAECHVLLLRLVGVIVRV